MAMCGVYACLCTSLCLSVYVSVRVSLEEIENSLLHRKPIKVLSVCLFMCFVLGAQVFRYKTDIYIVPYNYVIQNSAAPSEINVVQHDFFYCFIFFVFICIVYTRQLVYEQRAKAMQSLLVF